MGTGSNLPFARLLGKQEIYNLCVVGTGLQLLTHLGSVRKQGLVACLRSLNRGLIWCKPVTENKA